MKILFVSIYFHPEPNFFMGLPFAKELVRRGHEVEVLTSFPNYPGGRIYKGYKQKLWQRDVIDGIPVIRVPLFPSHDSSSFRRILTYLSFAFTASVLGTALIRRADVAYYNQGPVSDPLPACIMKLLRRIPFVYNIQDFEPDSLKATGMFNNRLGLWLVDKWLRFVYRVSSKVVTITPGFKRTLVERGIPESKLDVVHNWCDDSQIQLGELKPGLAKELGMEGRFNIVFAGNIGKAQALDAVLDAAALLRNDCPDVLFTLVGAGVAVEELKNKAAAMRLKNVQFLARRPSNEIGSILRLADMLLLHLKDDPVYRITIPSKTQAYLAIGRPVLIAMRGDATELVLRAKAGLACEPENVDSIAETVRKARSIPRSELEQMGSNGRRFYEQELSLTVGAGKYERIFTAIAAAKKIDRV